MTATSSIRIVHGFGVAALLYHVGVVVQGGGATGGVGGWSALAIWSFFAVMLIRRPAKWSLGMGILLLSIALVQSGLWWLAVSRGKAEANWMKFAASETPYLIGAVCCLRLWSLLRKSRAGAD